VADKVHRRELKDGSVRWDAIAYLRDPNTSRRKQVQKTFEKERDAERWVTEQESAVNNGTAVLPSSMTMQEVMEYWLENFIRHHKSPKTYVSYQATVRLHIVPKFGKIQVQKLTAARLQSYCTEMVKLGKGVRTIELGYTNIKQALEQAVRLDLVPKNVANNVTPPRWKPREMEVWLEEEARRFMSVADQSSYGPIWLLMLSKGLRKGEALGLRWCDVDLDRGTLRIVQTVGALHGKVVIRGTKTAASRREVTLRSGVIAALRAHKIQQLERRLQLAHEWQDHDLVFTAANGGPIHPDNLDRDFDRLVRLAAVKRIRIHDLRHTYATLALATGEHVKLVSETLGHADVATTLRTYAHVLPSQRVALADKMESLLLACEVQEKSG
jgi:integrase